MRIFAAITAFILALASPVQAATLTVMCSGAFTAALDALAPAYEKQTHNHLVIIHGPSMGVAPTAIPLRLARGEKADVVILARSGLDNLLAKHLAVEPADLVISKTAMAVKAGSKLPDISTLAAFKKTLLAAKSVAYSDSASGVYIETEMYKNLGIEKQMAPKSHKIQATPVGLNIARGEEELGFQQLAELKPIPGITIVGFLPEGAQRLTIFSSGVSSNSDNKPAARALIAWLKAPARYAAIRQTGLIPAGQKD
jgi:molybdate transport system substrate-binding protein